MQYQCQKLRMISTHLSLTNHESRLLIPILPNLFLLHRLSCFLSTWIWFHRPPELLWGSRPSRSTLHGCWSKTASDGARVERRTDKRPQNWRPRYRRILKIASVIDIFDTFSAYKLLAYLYPILIQFCCLILSTLSFSPVVFCHFQTLQWNMLVKYYITPSEPLFWFNFCPNDVVRFSLALQKVSPVKNNSNKTVGI